jgi:hypothetical protein
MLQINNFTYIINTINSNQFDLYSTVNTGTITFASKTNPCVITSPAHGLITGQKIMISGVNGMVNLNNIAYTITLVDVNNFSLNGIDATGFPMYLSGGTWYLAVDSTGFTPYAMGASGIWSIAFADQNYLTFTIFTDPRFITTNPGWSVGAWSFTPWGAPNGESITCDITVNRAAQIAGNQNNINTVNVQFGHKLVATTIILITASNGMTYQRNVISVTATSITFDGFPISVLNGVYIAQFFDILFRKGFDVVSPYLISTFIATITAPSTGIYGLNVAINGRSDLAAAFLQIIEPLIIDSNAPLTIDYWYWQQVNSTIFPNPPLPGSANLAYQNSSDFENASMADFLDVIYIANGWDYPQKYDGQTVYRAGMPEASRVMNSDNTTFPSLPFVTGNVYQYGISYEQIDNRGNLVEGQISEINQYSVISAHAAINISYNNLNSSIGNNWNTDTAIYTTGVITVYGPDVNGFYYDLVPVNTGFTLEIGDMAYYGDFAAAVSSGAVVNSFVIPVVAGFSVLPGDTVYFIDTAGVEHKRIVSSVSNANLTINIMGDPVTISMSTNFTDYEVSEVFGNVAIVNGDQTNVNTINVNVGYTINPKDIVSFTDSLGNLQRRNVTATGAGTITIDQTPVTIFGLTLIASENQRTNAITLQRLNPVAANMTNPFNGNMSNYAVISNNLRVNIYRTLVGQNFNVPGTEIYLVASIPNDGTTAVQNYIDGLPDSEIQSSLAYSNPAEIPTPPPISKYVKAFGNQMFYGGGERGQYANSDNVFFSQGNQPEVVPLATNFVTVPNMDDDITGLGISGTTFVITKNNSLWAVTGSTLTGQVQVLQIAQGKNIGCAAHASIATVGTLMYFLHTNGVYAITENQLFPTDPFGNPIPLSLPIDVLFRETPYLPSYRFVLKRSVAVNFTKDNQYLLFIPTEDANSQIRTANVNSVILCYDYQEKNWFSWNNMNAAGGMVVIDDDLYFQERRFSGVNGNSSNLYKQHRFYRLVDHADHAGPQMCAWKSSWEDLGQPEVRKKFSHCVLLMNRLSDLFQYNNPKMVFSTYLNRLGNLQNTIANITQTDNVRNSSWSYSTWGWGYWSGYQDTFVTVNLKGGTVAKSIQVGFTIQGINMDIRLAGFQLEAIPENRKTIAR